MQELTVNEILSNYSVDSTDLNLEGIGYNGEAYSFNISNRKYVIKFTNKKDEFKCAEKLRKLQNENHNINNTIYKHSAKIFELGIFKNTIDKPFNYYIIMEFIIIDRILSDKYWEYVEIKRHFGNDKEITYSDEEEKVFDLLNKIEKKLKSTDLHSENIGYGLDGIIKGFDWDKRRN